MNLRLALIALFVVNAASLAAPASPIVIELTARPPYAVVKQAVNVTVGETVSLVSVAMEFMYVRDYDTPDRLDPLLIDVPVVVREDDTDPGKVLKLANARIQIGRNVYQPREVLLLDHLAFAPVPDLPSDVRIAIVSFNIPRKSLKPRFVAQLAYDQPHVPADGGGELSAYVPLLPDIEQLKAAIEFKPDAFKVTFTALPDVRLRRDTVNTEVIEETPESIVVYPRHRETIAVVAEPVEEGNAPATGE